ncbi:MAG: hypothetical protein FWC72_08545 [Oscillospiraceae bacterium]|nr:hypothetical protein [Oscillospiraceae bacterium]
MKTKSKLLIALLAVLLVATSVLGYMWHTNRGLFQGNRVAGLPNAHLRVLSVEPSHFDLLFHRHNYGGVEFNHFGEGVHVYIAHYIGGERVLHEIVTGISIVGDGTLSGTVRWGLTMEENEPHELRIHLRAGAGSSQNYFDFSQFDFVVRAMSGPGFPSRQIEQGERYILQRWQAGGMFPIDEDRAFDPDILSANEETVFLYMVFS